MQQSISASTNNPATASAINSTDDPTNNSAIVPTTNSPTDLAVSHPSGTIDPVADSTVNLPVSPMGDSTGNSKKAFSSNSLFARLQAFWERTYCGKPNQTRQPTLLGHGLIAGGLLTLNLMIFLLLSAFADARAKDWLANNQPFIMPEQNVIQTPIERDRLSVQLAEVQERRERHAKVMTYFYQQYFIALSMASGSALAAILFAFFISRDGWDKTNNGLINAFMMCSSAAVLYTQLPSLFQQETNLEANRTLYLAYDALGNEVLSYLATKRIPSTDPKDPKHIEEVEPNQFIHQVDQQLAKLNKIPVDFDASQIIKLPDLQKIGLPAGLPTVPQAGSIVQPLQ